MEGGASIPWEDMVQCPSGTPTSLGILAAGSGTTGTYKGQRSLVLVSGVIKSKVRNFIRTEIVFLIY